MRIPSLRREFLVDHLDLEEASGVEGAQWEPFQIAHLDDDAMLRIENKSRQIAWSWVCAAEAVTDAILARQSSIFVSINLAEAKEKIRYAKQVYHALRIGGLPALTSDSQLHLEFDNGARLLSMPSRPPRGKARHNVYLDEFAHLQRPRDIYAASLPIISKGGRLRIGSTPFGPQGLFWELFAEQLQPYPDYQRATTPWWMVGSMCTDVRTAKRIAPTLTQAERVARFGRERLKLIFSNMLAEDFGQEYECSFADESSAWITWAEWQAVQSATLHCEHVTCTGKAIDAALAQIDRLAQMVRAGTVEAHFTLGMDVGRTHDTTELYVTGISTTGVFPLRLAVTLDRTPFAEQMAVAELALRRLPISKAYIDRTGIGMQVAEQLEMAFPVKAEGVAFTNPAKMQWATEARMLVQQRRVAVPIERELAYQVASVKRVKSGATVLFDVERTSHHHADKFWAWALAVYAASQMTRGLDIVRVIGKRR
jgi:phage FluMu gp28-like protein